MKRWSILKQEIYLKQKREQGNALNKVLHEHLPLSHGIQSSAVPKYLLSGVFSSERISSLEIISLMN